MQFTVSAKHLNHVNLRPADQTGAHRSCWMFCQPISILNKIEIKRDSISVQCNLSYDAAVKQSKICICKVFVSFLQSQQSGFSKSPPSLPLWLRRQNGPSTNQKVEGLISQLFQLTYRSSLGQDATPQVTLCIHRVNVIQSAQVQKYSLYECVCDLVKEAFCKKDFECSVRTEKHYTNTSPLTKEKKEKVKRQPCKVFWFNAILYLST